MRLDSRPKSWESRTILFCAHLIEKGVKSATIKSYVSAIKHLVSLDHYEWSDNRVTIKSLKKVNDTVKIRFPIHLSLLETILFELGRVYSNDPYLLILYRTIFCIGYYGLFRVSELGTQQSEDVSDHAIKLLMCTLESTKTSYYLFYFDQKHMVKNPCLKKIKISANTRNNECMGNKSKCHFCPFKLMRCYMQVRGNYYSDTEQLFIFSDRSPVQPSDIRATLQNCLSRLGLDPSLYGTHSLRISRSTDLIKAGFTVEEVKRMGHWKSNAVYCYIIK